VRRSTFGWSTPAVPPVLDPPPAERTTVTKLYGAPADTGDPQSSFAPAFDPGGNFNGAWMLLPQPLLSRRAIDGPRTDVEDVTSFVYYPVHESVPAQSRGKLAATRNALGHITRFEFYDLFGNAARVDDPNEVTTETISDSLGRLRTQAVKGLAFCDTASDPLCVQDLVTTRIYSSEAGPLQTEQRPGGGVTVYGYDSRGRVVTVTRGPSPSDLRERIETTWDAATGKKSLERFLAFEGGAWVEKKREAFAYDTLGELLTETHADGTSVGYTYDQEGRLSGVRDDVNDHPIFPRGDHVKFPPLWVDDGCARKRASL
jgi:YD repeat-containing protein